MAEDQQYQTATNPRRRERLVALALLGVLLFNHPLMGLFDRLQLWFGIPLLYLYLFSAWGLFILLAALVLEGPSLRRRKPVEPPPPGPGEKRP